jgi:hypothetical protein
VMRRNQRRLLSADDVAVVVGGMVARVDGVLLLIHAVLLDHNVH